MSRDVFDAIVMAIAILTTLVLGSVADRFIYGSLP